MRSPAMPRSVTCTSRWTGVGASGRREQLRPTVAGHVAEADRVEAERLAHDRGDVGAQRSASASAVDVDASGERSAFAVGVGADGDVRHTIAVDVARATAWP